MYGNMWVSLRHLQKYTHVFAAPSQCQTVWHPSPRAGVPRSPPSSGIEDNIADSRVRYIVYGTQLLATKHTGLGSIVYHKQVLATTHSKETANLLTMHAYDDMHWVTQVQYFTDIFDIEGDYADFAEEADYSEGDDNEEEGKGEEEEEGEVAAAEVEQERGIHQAPSKFVSWQLKPYTHALMAILQPYNHFLTFLGGGKQGKQGKQGGNSSDDKPQQRPLQTGTAKLLETVRAALSELHYIPHGEWRTPVLQAVNMVRVKAMRST